MPITKAMAAILLGVGLLISGCGERKENPVDIQKDAVPPVPVVPPGKIGPSGQRVDPGPIDPPGSQPPTGESNSPAPGTQPKTEGPTGESNATGINTTVAEIMKRTDLHVGRVVTVVSEVEEIFTPWSFKLDEKQALSAGVDNDILVVGAVPLTSLGFEESWKDSKVKVTGTVRVLQAEDFRREYGRGVDDKLFRRFEGKPAIIAQSIEKAG